MPYARTFDHYDPFAGERLPDSFPPELNGVAQRARIILKDWKRGQLVLAAQDLRHIFIRTMTAGWVEAAKRVDELGDRSGFFSDVEQFRLYFRRNENSGEERSLKHTEVEYLAILALAAIGQIVNLHTANPQDFEPFKYGFATNEFTSIAMEAISAAEAINESASNSGKKGSDAQKQRYVQIQQECLELFDSHFSHIQNYNQAAQAIYARLPDETKALFWKNTSEDGRKKRIAAWLSAERPHS